MTWPANDPTPKQADRIKHALAVYAEALWECAEWNRDDSDEPYARVEARCDRAKARLYTRLRLPVDVEPPAAREIREAFERLEAAVGQPEVR